MSFLFIFYCLYKCRLTSMPIQQTELHQITVGEVKMLRGIKNEFMHSNSHINTAV